MLNLITNNIITNVKPLQISFAGGEIKQYPVGQKFTINKLYPPCEDNNNIICFSLKEFPDYVIFDFDKNKDVFRDVRELSSETIINGMEL